MNYRHAFHAGNFADVLKHAVLCRILVYLRQKPAAFRVLDTHAGAGRFDLAGNEASRTGEWRAGIGRLLTASLAPQAAELLAPYLDIVRQANSDAANSEQPNSEHADSGGPLRVYPGSPLIAQALLRSQDRLVSCELEPGAVTALGRHLGGDRRAKAVEIDGWTALGAYLPPPERRGVVLIDPPFEKPDEFGRLATGLTAAYRKWPGGSYMLWYPIKDYRTTDAFAARLRQLGISKLLRIELASAPVSPDDALSASGLVVVNPPFTLQAEMAILLPAMRDALAPDGRGSLRLDWLAGEK
jgi:23S rRNA (adenine2030-N6)-methyltransferase